MKKLKLLPTFCIVLLICCSKNRENSYMFNFQIDNCELKKAIIEYQELLFDDNAKRILCGDSIYVCVSSRNLSDSIVRFVLSPIVDSNSLLFEAPFFVCQVNGHTVFFTSSSIHPNYYLKPNFFSASKEIHDEMIMKYFPKELDMVNRLEREIYLYEPANCYLTFKYDSLIGKTYQRGAWMDKVPININGITVYM